MWLLATGITVQATITTAPTHAVTLLREPTRATAAKPSSA